MHCIFVYRILYIALVLVYNCHHHQAHEVWSLGWIKTGDSSSNALSSPIPLTQCVSSTLQWESFSISFSQDTISVNLTMFRCLHFWYPHCISHIHMAFQISTWCLLLISSVFPPKYFFFIKDSNYFFLSKALKWLFYKH